ncbi:hypothetical protein KGF57_004188 [Candida theae]|uniref:Uncharacterized protein n=1 Tax=Candida theae TaxID=1198502 RepID=A0AAD5BBS2_9ASCO|nr:uncharacterized protein KGF57_004188 [Candida theae]KAI5952140.1 hypothetical protein KGF57_004188 [Candida theae]
MPVGHKVIAICTIIAVLLPWIPNIYKPSNGLSKLQHYVDCEFKAVVPIAVRFNNEHFILPDLIPAAQIQIDEEIRALDVRHLDLVLVDNLSAGNVSQGYMMDLILHHENSLGISSDSLQVAIFYTLESIHSNDLPFFVAQTVLYHFLNGEIELFKSSEVDYFLDDLEFEIGFGNAVNKTKQLEISKTVEKLGSDVHLITHFTWTINNKLANGGNDIVINFPGKRSKTIKNDAHATFKIQTVLEDELRLPPRPGNNLQVRLFASYRKKTLSNVKHIMRKLSERGGHDAVLPRLAQLILEMSNSREASWLAFLKGSQDILSAINATARE